MACLVKKMDYLTKGRPHKVNPAYMGFIVELMLENLAGVCSFRLFMEKIF